MPIDQPAATPLSCRPGKKLKMNVALISQSLAPELSSGGKPKYQYATIIAQNNGPMRNSRLMR